MATDDENVLLALLNSTPVTPTKLDNNEFDENTENDSKKQKSSDDDSKKTISLGVRQPSFSSLSGTLIPKGKDTPLDLSILQETEGDPVVVLSKPESLKVFQSNSLEHIVTTEEELTNLSQSPEGSPLPLKYRQPSFSSLDSDHLLLKGDIQVSEDTLQTIEDEQQSSMVQQLALSNAERWHKMGYDPIPMQRNCSYQTFPQSEKKLDHKTVSKSVSNIPPLKDNFHLSQTGTLFTSNHKLDLEIEMPEEIPEEDLMEAIQEDEETYATQQSKGHRPESLQENQPDLNNEISHSDRKHKKTPQVKKGKQQFSQTYSFSGKKQKNTHQSFSQTSPKRSRNNESDEKQNDSGVNYEGLPEEFHLDLTECSREQGYDSEQGSSRIPDRIKQIVEEKGIPKESITYLALCQQSIAGYRERTFRKTIQELKELQNFSIQLGFIAETEYISSIIDSNIKEYNELNSMKDKETKQSLRKQIEAVKAEREEVIKEFDMEQMHYEAERDTKIQTLTDEYNLDLDLIDDTWTSEKKQAEYSKPSAKLVQMRKQAERLLKFKRFKDAAVLNNECKKLERQESEAAGKKLQNDYKQAVKKRQEKCNNDIETTKQFFNKRMSDLHRRKNLELRKYDNKISSLEEKIKQMPKESTAKKGNKKTVQIQNTSGLSVQTRGSQSSSRRSTDIASGSEPLKLPQLKTVSRSRPSTSQSQTRKRQQYA